VIGRALDMIGSYGDLNNREQVVALIDEVYIHVAELFVVITFCGIEYSQNIISKTLIYMYLAINCLAFQIGKVFSAPGYNKIQCVCLT
jgi:hypothetical protein